MIEIQKRSSFLYKAFRCSWKSLNIPYCEVNLILTWSKNCVLTDMTTHGAVPLQGNVPTILAIAAPIGATFTITDTKLYVPVVTLSTQDDNKLLEKLKRALHLIELLNGINIDLQ